MVINVKVLEITLLKVKARFGYGWFDLDHFSLGFAYFDQDRAHPAISHCSQLLLKCRVATNISHRL